MEEHSAGAVIFRLEKGRAVFLVLHYEEGHWDFPKGHVETGETPRAAARREVFEETGIRALDFAPGFRARITYPVVRKGRRVPKKVDYFLAGTGEGTVHLSREHTAFAWLPLEGALERVTYKSAKAVLAKAARRLSARAPASAN